LDIKVYTQDDTQWRLRAESNTCPNVANFHTIERERERERGNFFVARDLSL
jgi:hypothetical protein